MGHSASLGHAGASAAHTFGCSFARAHPSIRLPSSIRPTLRCRFCAILTCGHVIAQKVLKEVPPLTAVAVHTNVRWIAPPGTAGLRCVQSCARSDSDARKCPVCSTAYSAAEERQINPAAEALESAYAALQQKRAAEAANKVPLVRPTRPLVRPTRNDFVIQVSLSGSVRQCRCTHCVRTRSFECPAYPLVSTQSTNAGACFASPA